MRINKRAIEDLDRKPKPAARETFWDDKLPGFGVRRSPKGKISFVVKIRVRGDTRQRFITLGDWPSLLPDDARSDAENHRAAGAKGRDLEAERGQEAESRRAVAVETNKRAIPLDELLDGWRVKTERDLAERLKADQVGSYEKELLRLEKAVLRPALKGQTVGGFDAAGFQDLLDRQESPSTAGNLRALIMRFTKHVSAEMKARSMPIAWPKTYELHGKIGRRWDRYTLEQAARIWIAAGQLGRRGALIRFMLLTASRRSEAARVRRARLLLGEPGQPPYWLHVGGTTKNRKEYRSPLSRPAVALLAWLPDRSTRTTPDTGLLFAGRGGKVVSSWSGIATALRTLSGLTTGTFHDFRRTIVSTLGDHGFDPVTTDMLLNHSASATMPGVMGTYQQSELLKKRAEAVELWADQLFAAIDKVLGKPLSRETWGFDKPFEEKPPQRPQKLEVFNDHKIPSPFARRHR
jgi:integrase